MHAFEDNDDDASIFERFEKMINDEGKPAYFDVEDLELIIENYFILQRTEEAIKAIDYGIHLHPEAGVFPLFRAKHEIYEGSEKLGKFWLQKAAQLMPNHWEVFFTYGSFWSSNDSNKAVHFFKKALEVAEEEEDKAQVLGSLGAEYQSLGKYNEALDCFKELLEIDPSDEIAMLGLSVCFDDTLDSEGAIKYFEKFIEKNPFSETAWFHLGVNYAFVANYKKAVTCFDFAIVIDDHFSAAFYEKARCEEEMGNFEDAIDSLIHCSENEEDPSFTFYKIGSLYSQIEEFENAKTYFTKALELQEDMPEPNIELALILAREGHFEQAIKLTLGALDATDWENSDFLTIASEFFLSLGDESQLRKVTLALLKTGDIYPNQIESFTFFLLERGAWKEALQIVRDGMKLLPIAEELSALYAGIVMIYKNKEEGAQLIAEGMDRNPYFFDLLVSYFPDLDNRTTDN